jgi:hypothetical protein
MSHRVLLFLTVVGSTGCFGYYPAPGAQPAGRDVQVTLSDSGSVVLAAQIGYGAETIFGHVQSDSESRLALLVSGIRQRDGSEVKWKGERIIVPKPLIRDLEERRFSRARTTLFSGALAVALVSLRAAFQGNGTSSAGSGLPGQGGTK